MRRLQWILVRWGDRVGVPGMVALVLALAAVLYVPAVLWPAQHRLESLAGDTEKPRDGGNTTEVTESPAHAFLTTFPGPDTLSVQLQTIFDMAEQYGLALDEVSYKQERKAGEALSRYHVDFSLDAPYADARAFLLDILAALPYVSLDQLAIDRESVKSDTVQTRVRLTLHLVQR